MWLWNLVGILLGYIVLFLVGLSLVIYVLDKVHSILGFDDITDSDLVKIEKYKNYVIKRSDSWVMDTEKYIAEQREIRRIDFKSGYDTIEIDRNIERLLDVVKKEKQDLRTLLDHIGLTKYERKWSKCRIGKFDKDYVRNHF